MKILIAAFISSFLLVATASFSDAIKTGTPPYYLATNVVFYGFMPVNDKAVPFVRSSSLNKVANVIGLSNVLIKGKAFNEVLVPGAVITHVDSIGNIKMTHIGHWANNVKFRVPKENYAYFYSAITMENLKVKETGSGTIGGMGYRLFELDYEQDE